MNKLVQLRTLYLGALIGLLVIGIATGLSKRTAVRNLVKAYEQITPEQRQDLIQKLPPAWAVENERIVHWNIDHLELASDRIYTVPIGDATLYYQLPIGFRQFTLTFLFTLFAFFFYQQMVFSQKNLFHAKRLARSAIWFAGGYLILFLSQDILKWWAIPSSSWKIIWVSMGILVLSSRLFVQYRPKEGHRAGYIFGLFLLTMLFSSLQLIKQSIFLGDGSLWVQIISWWIGVLAVTGVVSTCLLIIKMGRSSPVPLTRRLINYSIVSAIIACIWLLQENWQSGLIFGLVSAIILLLMDLTVDEKRPNFLWWTVWAFAISLLVCLLWWSQSDDLVYLMDVFNYFSLSFVGILILLGGIIALNSLFDVTWGWKHIRLTRPFQLRQKIELLVIGTLVLSFVGISGLTYILENDRSHKLIQEQLNSIQYGAPSEYILQDEFEVVRFEEDDLIINSNRLPDFLDLPPYQEWSNPEINQRPELSGDQVFWKEKTGTLAVFRPIQRTFLESFGESLVSRLFNLYVFLFILCVGAIYLITQSITRPLAFLGDQLENISLGKANPRIEWSSQDEVGQLIQRYNVMLDQLDHSAETLATTERDQAWREMAKQVAHEIKNPLTPMKLSIQYLQMKAQGATGPLPDQVKKTAQTLIEQIDNMTRIAENFSQFGSLPQVSNQRVLLNEVVTSVHDLFRKREDMDIQCRIPIDDCYVFADKDHLIRIFNNILKNAIQAIPRDRKGEILIKLERHEHHALVTIQDNGEGIPEDRIDKIFRPNFTTKRSGTGLGLAMCSKMIDSMDGKIYFETEVDRGTTFFIEIPLLRIEENYSEEEATLD